MKDFFVRKDMHIFGASSRKNFLLSCVVTLIVIQTVTCCDSNKCCYNHDCWGSHFCRGGNGVFCKCRSEWWKSAYNYGWCTEKYNDGQLAHNGDSASCKSNREQCGYCGAKNDNWRPCSKNSYCKSDWCDGGSGFGCGGTCKPRGKNGARAPSNGFGGWDYNYCEIRAGQCGYCGPSNANGLPCGENSDCSSGWCNGFVTTNCGGVCKAKAADGQAAFKRTNSPPSWDYNSCQSGTGKCGYCGSRNANGRPCGENSDCDSNWCEGTVTSLCSATCRARRDNGQPAYQVTAIPPVWDYKSCKSLTGTCGFCSSGVNRVGLPCSEHSDCSRYAYCDGDLTLLCGGTCRRKIDDNMECPQLWYEAFNGVNQACKSGECMELAILDPTITTAYCRPPGGFGEGVPCTQDSDCSLAGSGLWCNGGASDPRPKLGKCERCPSNCSNGCHACDNDLDRLICGRSSTLDKIGCAGEVAADKAVSFLECLLGIELACLDEIATQTEQCLSNNECIFEISSACLGVEYEEEVATNDLFENQEEISMTVTGNMSGTVGFDLKFDPKQWTIEVTAKGNIQSTATALLSSNAAYVTSEEKALTKQKKLLMKKVLLLGKLPVLIEVHVQPWMFADFSMNGASDATLQLSNKAGIEQTVSVDIDDALLEVTQPVLNFPDGPVSIDDLSITGEFNAEAFLRIGPRLSISVYKIPVDFDLVARVGANVNLQASASTENACISGSAGMNVGVDARISSAITALDPVEFARTACQEGASLIAEELNPINIAVDRAQCFTDILDIDTSEIDDAQESIGTFLDDFCDAAIDFLVPSEVQQFSCQLGAATALTADWIELFSVKPNIDATFCTDETVTELGSGMSTVFENFDACA